VVGRESLVHPVRGKNHKLAGLQHDMRQLDRRPFFCITRRGKELELGAQMKGEDHCPKPIAI